MASFVAEPNRRALLHLTLIVLVAAVPKAAKLNAPFLDAYWMRDLMVASIAHNYLEKGINLMMPETDYTPDQPNYIEMELPLTAALTAAVWRVTGEHDWVPRLLSVLWSSGAIVLFFLLCRRFLSAEAALAATWVFALSPINLFLGRKFMPEPMTLCLSLACLWAGVRWLGLSAAGGSCRAHRDTRQPCSEEAGHAVFLILAALAGSLAALTKPPILHVLLPLLWLMVAKRGWKGLLDWRHLAFAVVVLAPTALWMRHAAHLGEQYWSVGTTFAGGSWFSLGLLTDPGFISLMVQRFVENVFTPVGVVGLLAGLALVRWRDPAAFFTVWLLGVGVYFLVLLGGNARQTYYQLWFVAPAAGLAGVAWERLVGWGFRRDQLETVPVSLPVRGTEQTEASTEERPDRLKPVPPETARRLVGWLLGGLLVCALWGVHNYYDHDTPVLEAKAALDIVDPARSPVIVYPAGYNCLYYLRRPGWCGRDVGRDYDMGAAQRPEYITARIARGAKLCLIFTDPKPADFRDHQTEAYLAAHFPRVCHEAGFEIYRLQP